MVPLMKQFRFIFEINPINLIDEILGNDGAHDRRRG